MSFDISLNFFLAFAGLALLLCVTLNIALPGPGDPQTFRRNIARDHGTGASHGPVTHLHGSHKYRIRPRVNFLADDCPVFAGTVVIGGYVAGGDIATRPNLRIAYITQVWHLGAFTHPAILDLDERPRF